MNKWQSLNIHYGTDRSPATENVCLIWLGLRWGAFTCVGWQVTLCDHIWQVRLHSSRTGSRRGLYPAFNAVCLLAADVVMLILQGLDDTCHSVDDHDVIGGITFAPPTTQRQPRSFLSHRTMFL